MILFFFLLIIKSVAADNNDCKIIAVCPDFEITAINDTDRRRNDKPPVPEYEHEVARLGHVNGIKPIRYQLNLNFINQSHYNGSLDISFKVVAPTNQIVINQHPENPTIDYKRIKLQKRCLHSENSKSSDQCVQNGTFQKRDQTLVLQLKSELDTDDEYAISFPSFSGKSRGKINEEGAVGLNERIARQFEQDGTETFVYGSTTTIFQMRNARSVFPCFDQPALKSTFSLCVDHPAEIDVASNTPAIDSSIKSIDQSRKSVCFEDTPRMSTYLFTFALMQNHTVESVEAPEIGLTVELYAPRPKIDNLRWVLNETIPVFEYLQNIAQFKSPLKRLGFVVQYSAPFWGVENFGLVTIEGSFTEERRPIAYSILHHEIIHQWLGDIVTVSDWREVCLQEAIVSYLQWVITSRRVNGTSFEETVDKARRGTDTHYTGSYGGYIRREYHVTKDIEDQCFVRPPFFIHTVAAAFGFETIEKFVAILVAKKPYGTAAVEIYDNAMSEATNGSLQGYFTEWFGQPGPLYLLATRVDSNCILIRQQLYDKKNFTPVATVPRHVPLVVQSFGQSPIKKSIVLESLDNRVCGFASLDQAGFIVDPQTNTVTRKVYHAENYRHLLNEHKANPDSLSKSEMSMYGNNFCRALFSNALPLDDDTANGSDWLQVYDLFLKSGVHLGDCECCLKENASDDHCPSMGCADLRLSKVVGLKFEPTKQTEETLLGRSNSQHHSNEKSNLTHVINSPW